MQYIGKGSSYRAATSANRIFDEYHVKATDIDWKPAANNREAFKAEYRKMKNAGWVPGQGCPNLYNKITSPGRLYSIQDGEEKDMR